MLHIGIGATQLNNLLSVLNLPLISQSSLKEREREIGPAIEEVGRQAISQALDEEVEATARV